MSTTGVGAEGKGARMVLGAGDSDSWRLRIDKHMPRGGASRTTRFFNVL